MVVDETDDRCRLLAGQERQEITGDKTRCGGVDARHRNTGVSSKIVLKRRGVGGSSLVVVLDVGVLYSWE